MQLSIRLVLSGLAAAMLMTSVHAQTPPGAGASGAPAGPGGFGGGATELATATLGKDKEPSLEVTVAGGLTDDQGFIRDRYTGRGEEKSPPLQWSAGPDGTKSYVVIMQNPIVEVPNMVISQWLVYNIPADVTSLPEGVPEGASIESVPGAVQMATARVTGYMAPGGGGMLRGGGAPGGAGASSAGAGAPPTGSAQTINNPYVYQVFALDTTLDAPADYPALMSAMEGHVLAYGSLGGLVVMPAMGGAPGGTPPTGTPPAQ